MCFNFRRRNQKRMDKEFGGFRSEKNSLPVNTPNTGNGTAAVATKEKMPFTITDTAFIEVSSSIRNYENSTETHGTYRSRNINNGYDSTADDPNMSSRGARQVSPPPPPPASSRPRVDHDEYWRTNI